MGTNLEKLILQLGINSNYAHCLYRYHSDKFPDFLKQFRKVYQNLHPDKLPQNATSEEKNYFTEINSAINTLIENKRKINCAIEAACLITPEALENEIQQYQTLLEQTVTVAEQFKAEKEELGKQLKQSDAEKKEQEKLLRQAEAEKINLQSKIRNLASSQNENEELRRKMGGLNSEKAQIYARLEKENGKKVKWGIALATGGLILGLLVSGGNNKNYYPQNASAQSLSAANSEQTDSALEKFKKAYAIQRRQLGNSETEIKNQKLTIQSLQEKIRYLEKIKINPLNEPGRSNRLTKAEDSPSRFSLAVPSSKTKNPIIEKKYCRLKIEFNEETDLKTYQYTGTNWKRDFFNIRVRNLSNETAKGCTARLNILEKTVGISTNTSYPLHWAYIDDSLRTDKDLGPNPSRLDVIFTDQRMADSGGFIATPETTLNRTNRSFLPPGTYTLEVSVNCKNHENDKKRFIFTSPGRREKLTVLAVN